MFRGIDTQVAQIRVRGLRIDVDGFLAARHSFLGTFSLACHALADTPPLEFVSICRPCAGRVGCDEPAIKSF